MIAGLTFHYETPREMTPERLGQVRDLVADCGGVPTMRLTENLANAFLVSYALDGDEVVGSVTLKRPRPQFLEGLRLKTGLDLAGWLERGYTAVAPPFRGGGLAKYLVRELTRRAEGMPVYVIIAADNDAAQGVSRANRMRPVARYFSQRLGKYLDVWIGLDAVLPGEDE